jgi:hypothetical protein
MHSFTEFTIHLLLTNFKFKSHKRHLYDPMYFLVVNLHCLTTAHIDDIIVSISLGCISLLKALVI